MATLTTGLVATVTVTATATVTAQMTTLPSILPYMENPTAVLSTVGLFLVIVGIQIMAIVGFSGLTLVPILSSLGNAIGCGLSHYLWFTDYSIPSKLPASVFADLAWLLQEITLPMYSFLIVRKILSGKENVIFHVVFIFMTIVIFALRMVIIPTRVENFLIIDRTGVVSDPTLQKRLDGLHVAYFTCIAFNESWCAFFLIKKFHNAQAMRESLATSQSGKKSILLYKKLALSTEIRLIFVAIIGIARAVSFSYQTEAPTANTIPGQIDRFISVFEALIPVVFYVDMLASKVIFHKRYAPESQAKSASISWKSSQRQNSRPRLMSDTQIIEESEDTYKLTDTEPVVERIPASRTHSAGSP